MHNHVYELVFFFFVEVGMRYDISIYMTIWRIKVYFILTLFSHFFIIMESEYSLYETSLASEYHSTWLGCRCIEPLHQRYILKLHGLNRGRDSLSWITIMIKKAAIMVYIVRFLDNYFVLFYSYLQEMVIKYTCMQHFDVILMDTEATIFQVQAIGTKRPFSL